MGEVKTISGLLDGKDEIRTFLKNASDIKLKQYLKAGMPVKILPGNRWLAHQENIEQFFKEYTANPAEFIE